MGSNISSLFKYSNIQVFKFTALNPIESRHIESIAGDDVTKQNTHAYLIVDPLTYRKVRNPKSA